MNMRPILATVVCAAALAASVTETNAASMFVKQGEVLVNAGNGYVAATGVVDVPVGNTIMTQQGAAAQVAFADGCTINLGQGEVFVVQQNSPCITGATDPKPETLAQPEPSGMSSAIPYVLGAAAIGGVAVAASSGGGSKSSGSGGGGSGGGGPGGLSP